MKDSFSIRAGNPADSTGVSCAQGEVAKDVFEKYRLATYTEAGYKPFIIAAIIFLYSIRNPIQKLRNIGEAGQV